MARLIRSMALLVLGIVLSACDPGSGTIRKAEINILPNIDELARHIDNYPEIDNVEVAQSPEGRKLTLRGIKEADRIYSILYTGGNRVRARIEFTVNYKQRVLYSQEFLTIGPTLAQEYLNETVPIMERIEKDLEQRFGVSGLTRRVKVRYLFGTTPPQESTRTD